MLGCLAYAMLTSTTLGVLLPVDLAPGSPIAAASVQADDELAGMETISDAELSEHRGGFAWEGVQIQLGAEIRTYLDGNLVLQTNVSWTDAGAQTTQIVSGALTPVDVAQLQAGILSSGGISMHVGDSNVFLANGGQTAIIQQTDGSLQNIILNTASNVQVSSEVNAALDLGNFAQFQEGLLNMRLGEAIGDMIGQAVITGN